MYKQIYLKVFLTITVAAISVYLLSCSNKNNDASRQSIINGLFITDDGGDNRVVLGALATNVISPSYSEFATAASSFYTLAQTYQSSPTIANFTSLRSSYETLKNSLERIEIYAFNAINFPISLYLNIDFYPGFSLNTTDIEADEIGGTQTLDLARVQSLGATSRAIQGIEYFLYDNNSSSNDLTTNNNLLVGDSRRMQYLLALAEDMSIRAATINTQWQQTFKSEYTNGDTNFRSHADAIEKQVSLMVDMLTAFIDEKIGVPAGLSNKSNGVQNLERRESRYSNRSLEDIEQNFASIKNLYTGSYQNSTTVYGISNLVQRTNTTLDTKVKTEFQTIDSQISALKSQSTTLKNAIETNFTAVQTLYNQIRNLRIIFVTEVVSSLGASVQIGSSDGD
ncbi:MAG: imelysin family protein [Spirochaetota bacterium]